MDRRGVTRHLLLRLYNHFLSYKGITELLCFPQNLQKLIRSLRQKFRLLILPIFIGLDDSLHHFLLRTIKTNNVWISDSFADLDKADGTQSSAYSWRKVWQNCYDVSCGGAWNENVLVLLRERWS